MSCMIYITTVSATFHFQFSSLSMFQGSGLAVVHLQCCNDTSSLTMFYLLWLFLELDQSQGHCCMQSVPCTGTHLDYKVQTLPLQSDFLCCSASYVATSKIQRERRQARAWVTSRASQDFEGRKQAIESIATFQMVRE
ncbi:uncharacterized protein EDB93DRAFT_1164790 [Suillus bovinus]|uniref:uncharacterized protein n=1 Tax=Suillus bovinus TaxID=48563 RepID=UPI001B866D05|nr:uncharacterized protein EDB93DRAFT_1164790 [Suillus bovinus]KAG2138579.1 hypothetical protein EDB93DRAFT_1164790 [Suillus bovinus]